MSNRVLTEVEVRGCASCPANHERVTSRDVRCAITGDRWPSYPPKFEGPFDPHRHALPSCPLWHGPITLRLSPEVTP